MKLLREDRSAVQGKYQVDPECSQERALAGHVGTCNDHYPEFVSKLNVIQHAFLLRDERMAHLRGPYAEIVVNAGVAIGGVVECVGAKARQDFSLVCNVKPFFEVARVVLLPFFKAINTLQVIEKNTVDNQHGHAVESGVEGTDKICKLVYLAVCVARFLREILHQGRGKMLSFQLAQ